WEDGAAVAEVGTLQVRYDFAKGVGTAKTILGEKTADGKFVHDAVPLAGGKARVQVVDLGVSKALKFEDPQKKEAKQPDYRLEMVREGQRPAVVREDLEIGILVPSPDRKHVAVCCWVAGPDNEPQRSALLVIGPDGTIVANLELAALRKKN